MKAVSAGFFGLAALNTVLAIKIGPGIPTMVMAGFVGLSVFAACFFLEDKA